MQPNYTELTETELEEKIRIAREWLKDNENHPKYIEGLRRYVEIVGILRKKRGKKVNPRKGFHIIKSSKQYKNWFMSEYLRLEGFCPDCNEKMGARTREGRYATSDHIVELVNGGTNQFENLRVICNYCNSKKDYVRLTGKVKNKVKQDPAIIKPRESINDNLRRQIYRYVF
jgi:5-methylcytosine-specific restriction endonuclease McrA